MSYSIWNETARAKNLTLDLPNLNTTVYNFLRVLLAIIAPPSPYTLIYIQLFYSGSPHLYQFSGNTRICRISYVSFLKTRLIKSTVYRLPIISPEKKQLKTSLKKFAFKQI